MKILLTGISGHLGTNLTRFLLDKGFIVYGLTRAKAQILTQGVIYIYVDLKENWSYRALPTDIDIIIHLAQSENYRNFPDSAMDIYGVNIQSTAKLLDFGAKVGIKKFIYASSGGVYGNRQTAFSEKISIKSTNQLGYYLGSKTCGEILVQSYNSVFTTIIVRPFFIYGSNQKRNMLIPRLFDLVNKKQPIQLNGENGIRINPIHVQDAALALLSTIELDSNSIFNLAGPEVLSIRKICEEMAKYLEVQPIFEINEQKHGDIIGDISLMKKKLIVPQRLLFNHLCEL